MKSGIFNGSIHANKKKSANYVLQLLAQKQNVKLVHKEETGIGQKMQVGVRSESMGLI